ncbi:hypothetical protein [Streptomyces sp. IB2014 016-6]|uniref:hypothetical protein n=1 Tax=Streptomyces sp. IB2014 016-6 TaxID=2517818 RepID=UPI0011C773D4|nr:hypothetical protein [Streptomyces sp. IB2014 016-6]TXL91843.1 hypothetical protein EW053_06025 [Streptomyces sp. IB2014 016-6]
MVMMDRVKRNKVHRKNLKTVELAFNSTSLAAKDAIRRRDLRQQKLLTLNSAFLLGAIMENRLMAAISEPRLDEKRELRILRASSVNDMWRRALQEAFSQRYGVSPGSIPSRLSFTESSRYYGMLETVNTWIDPVISIRNSLAHGQWDVAFKSGDRTETSPPRTGELKRVTLWSLMLRKNLLDHWELLVFDLAVTKYAFERDFDRKWKNMRAAEERLKKGSAKQWEDALRKRYVRGRRHRAKNAHAEFISEQRAVRDKIQAARKEASQYNAWVSGIPSPVTPHQDPWVDPNSGFPEPEASTGWPRAPKPAAALPSSPVPEQRPSGWFMGYSEEPPF